MSPAATASSASAFAPLWERQAEWARRMAMVREARAFLYQSIFYIELDAYGREMLAALLAAQRRGVRVQLVIDGFGQRLGGVLMRRTERRALSAALAGLRHAGAIVTMYRPPRLMQRVLGGGHHVKIQVSEQGEAILGSGNITKSSFEGWNEYAVAVRGPVVPVLLESCRLIGGEVPEADVTHLQAQAATEPADLALDYWFCNPNLHQGPWGALGWRGPNALTDRMVAMVDGAARSLAVTSFYFKPTEPLMAAVLRAAARGVRVEVFHSHLDALPATDLAWIAAAASYGRLLEAGVRLYENRHGEHSKIVLVDDEWVACGSYNFEDAAHDRLAEAMLASRDARMVAPARAIIEGLRQDPDLVAVTRETMRQWPETVRRRVWRYGRFKRWM
ncbi:MAG: phosphatidylserine/phosphatidylglycerophosphate/cardiolipin synthase family protein [Acidobacteria bacterium]|nr:phosphatidylserine/phosphatidylglycerophosphate/cardiolipin synthase family protein [Acidobacteriota bacterium]